MVAAFLCSSGKEVHCFIEQLSAIAGRDSNSLFLAATVVCHDLFMLLQQQVVS